MGEAVQNGVEYKYLGCITQEYAKCRVMVKYIQRAEVGARALCARLRKCI